MPEEQIKRTLAELQEELATVENLDPSLKALLEQVDSDIHQLLNADAPEPGELTARLEALGARFAAQHPATERFFQELVATLGRIGI